MFLTLLLLSMKTVVLLNIFAENRCFFQDSLRNRKLKKIAFIRNQNLLETFTVTSDNVMHPYT